MFFLNYSLESFKVISLFSYQCSVVPVCLTAYSLYPNPGCLSRTFLFIFHSFFRSVSAERFKSYHVALRLSTVFFFSVNAATASFSRRPAIRCHLYFPLNSHVTKSQSLYSITFCFRSVKNDFQKNNNSISEDHWKLESGERGIWTLAPVTRPTPLAGAPLQPLEYFSWINNLLL